MKKAGGILLTVLGWLMAVPCFFGMLGGIGTLVNAGKDPETVKLTLLLAFGMLTGLFLITRRRLFRTLRPGKRTATGREPFKKAGISACLLLIAAAVLFYWGLIFAQRSLPLFFKLDRIYQPAAKVIVQGIAGILLLAAGVLLAVKTLGGGIRNCRPARRGFVIGFSIVIPLFLISIEMTVLQGYKNRPVPLVSERQAAGLRQIFGDRKLTAFREDRQEVKPEKDGWVAVQMPEDEEDALPDGRILAWSGAYIWSGFGWVEARPVAEDLESLGTAVLCQRSVRTADYAAFQWENRAAGSGSSEFVDLQFKDLETEVVYREEQEGRELPDSVTEIPHYVITDEELVKTIDRYMK